MEYISTRNTKDTFSFKDVFLNGLAPEGGLYVPKSNPKYSLKDLDKLKNLSYFDLIFMPHNVGEILQLQRSYFGQHTIRHKHSGKEIIPPWKTHG